METFESALLPVLSIKDTVIFPGAITPLFVIREDGLAAIEAAMAGDKRVFLATPLASSTEKSTEKDLNRVGCSCEILQVLKVPDGSAKILVEGLYAARAVDFMESEKGLQALLVRVEITDLDPRTQDAYIRTAKNLFEQYSELTDSVPEDLYTSISNLTDPLAVAYSISNYSNIRVDQKLRILESASLEEKYHLLNSALEKEIQVLELEDQIFSQVKNQFGQSQREILLNEQLKAIEKELGVGGEENPELDELSELIEDSGMPEEARQKAEKELSRLGRMAPLSPEATVARTYIEWLTDVPWQDRTEDQIELSLARKILDEDHYGLEKVKSRIVEYLAVAKLVGRTKGPILCFVGPPGVGKTSLAQSIARCIGREFARIALGGVRDEAEIRGHRRTYIGAMPGKIIQCMKKAGTLNPVILLDEIDKMSSDFRGDPASALLEVLDPEQNKHFVDHYLEVDYDLREVMFITTANTTANIPPPLLDRMEVIRLSGYTVMEKLQIARLHLFPKALKDNGLKKSDLSITKRPMEYLIQGYTRESGVRNLEREINSICRKLAMKIVEAEEEKKKFARLKVSPATVTELLGPVVYHEKQIAKKPAIGNVVGLAWTRVGGEILHIEGRTMSGKGQLTLTGKLGDVMKESARTALSYIRSCADDLEIDSDFHQKMDIHLHLPEGAIPKDGPSAGIALATCMASILAQKEVRQDLAMTGEMTLRGDVLKIGGLKEKALAAYRHQIKYVIIPSQNIGDLEEIPDEVKKKIEFFPVDKLEDVMQYAFSKGKRPSLKKANKKSSRKKKYGRRASRSQPRATNH